MKPASEAAECEVRKRRSEWATALKERYSPEALAWADPAQGMEKAAAVTLLHPPPDLGCGDDPLIVVAFRGSKAASDYFVTDASPRFVPLRRSVDLSGTGTLEDGGTYEYDFTPPEDASQRPRRSLAGIARTATFARRLSISRRSERAAKPGTGAAVEAGAEEGGEGGAGDGGSLEVSVQEAERRRASCPPLRDALREALGAWLGGGAAALSASGLAARVRDRRPLASLRRRSGARRGGAHVTGTLSSRGPSPHWDPSPHGTSRQPLVSGEWTNRRARPAVSSGARAWRGGPAPSAPNLRPCPEPPSLPARRAVLEALAAHPRARVVVTGRQPLRMPGGRVGEGGGGDLTAASLLPLVIKPPAAPPRQATRWEVPSRSSAPTTSPTRATLQRRAAAAPPTA